MLTTSLNILAMVGSCGITTVAIFADTTCIAKRSMASNTCSKLLAFEIKDLFAQTALSINDISVIATEQGPGSFTGLRVLIVTANALGLVGNIPVLGINSLVCLASPVLSTIKEEALLVALINAYGSQAYVAIFDTYTGRELYCNLCLLPEDLSRLIQNISGQKPLYILGQVSDSYKKRLCDSLAASVVLHFLPDNAGLPLVDELVKLALLKLHMRSLDSLSNEIRPIYVKSNFGGEPL